MRHGQLTRLSQDAFPIVARLRRVPCGSGLSTSHEGRPIPPCADDKGFSRAANPATVRLHSNLAAEERAMKSHARVVVIGGGVVGVSTLYHLTRKGWPDVVLCERTELTAGSTWHAAGLLPLFNMSYSVGQIHKYSVRLYPELEREAGQDVGFRPVGNIRLATNRDRMDEYRFYAGVARTIGGARRVPDSRRGGVDLAALQRRRPRRGHPAPRGRLHPARRLDAGVRACRPRPRRGDPPPHQGDRNRADLRVASGGCGPTRARSSASTW